MLTQEYLETRKDIITKLFQISLTLAFPTSFQVDLATKGNDFIFMCVGIFCFIMSVWGLAAAYDHKAKFIYYGTTFSLAGSIGVIASCFAIILA